MILFKIINGYYSNITFSENEEVIFDSSLIKDGDIIFLNQLENNSKEDLSESIKRFQEVLNTKITFNSKFIGLSKLDNFSIFLLDIKQNYREIKINNIINEK